MCRVGLWAPINPRVNKTHPPYSEVRREVFISGNLQALEMSREIVVHVEGASIAPGIIPFYGPVYPNSEGSDPVGLEGGTQDTPTTLT